MAKFTLADEKKETREVKEESKKNERIAFYCVKGQYSFNLPVYEEDEFGNPIRDGRGNPKKLVVYNGDMRTEPTQGFKFDRLPVRDEITGKTSAREFHGIFVISPEFADRWKRKDELVAYLNQRRKESAYNGVMTEDEYRKLRNPEAFEKGKKADKLQKQLDEYERTNRELREKLEKAGVKIEG